MPFSQKISLYPYIADKKKFKKERTSQTPTTYQNYNNPMHSSRDPSPLAPAARSTTLPTPSSGIPPTKQHHHRLPHHHHQHHNSRGPSRVATHPQSSGSPSGVYTADSDGLAGGKTGEESGTAGGKDEEEKRAVLRGKKVERVLGDKYDSSPPSLPPLPSPFPFPFFSSYCFL